MQQSAQVKSALRSSPLVNVAVVGFVLGLVLALSVPAVMNFFRIPPLPTLDANTQAYVLLLQGLKTGRYSEAKTKFDVAYSMASDQEIRYLADFFSRNCDLAISSGIGTYEEGNSVEGDIKGLVDGMEKPLDSLSAWVLMFKQWFGDFEKNCNIVDQRYQPQLRTYLQALDARNNASHFSWILFLATPAGLVFYANALRTKTTK